LDRPWLSASSATRGGGLCDPGGQQPPEGFACIPIKEISKGSPMSNRRSFLQILSGLPFFNSLSSTALAEPPKRDFLKELGVRPIINGAGAYTVMTGSLMNPESVLAIE